MRESKNRYAWKHNYTELKKPEQNPYKPLKCKLLFSTHMVNESIYIIQ